VTTRMPAQDEGRPRVKVKLFAPVDDEFDRVLRRSNRWAAATAAIVMLCAVINVVVIFQRF
jgi:hypothetical protein